jgi:hypothetical protein
MGIASYSGASSVIKPGVVTSSTRPSSPFVGQLIFETDTNRLAAYNGSAWVSQNSLQYITGASFTSATTISMAAGVFTSTYKTYQVIFQITSGADCQISVRVNNTGSPRTGSNYYGSSQRYPYTGTWQYVQSNAGTSLNIGANSTTRLYQQNLTVFNPIEATTRTELAYIGFGCDDNNSLAYQDGGGAYNVAEANDGLTWLAGAAVTGFYRVYGLTES